MTARRFGVSDARIDEGNVEATTRFGAKVRFPSSELVGVHVRSPSCVYLTERKPVQSYAIFLMWARPVSSVRIGRSTAIFFALARSNVRPRIGAQSRTLLAFPIEPGDRRFQALVGVDERAGPLAASSSACLWITRSGSRASRSRIVTHRRSIDLDLSGGKFLILDTDFGDRGNIRDLADWVEARLVPLSFPADQGCPSLTLLPT